MSPLRLPATLGALLAIVPAAGCCSLARLFCGPDRTPWVSIRYDSARDTLATFLEAIRRDRPDVAYDCLSEGFKREQGLLEVGSLGFHVLWERLHEKVPYLHYAGYATIPERPEQQERNGVTYRLEVDGRPLQVDLVCQSYWDVRYTLPNGGSTTAGRFLDHAALTAMLRIERLPDAADPDADPQSSLDLLPLRFAHPGRQAVAHDDIEYVAVGRAWKIAKLSQLAP